MPDEVTQGLPLALGKDGKPALCLVTGATGYIGGRLVRELLQHGYRVRVLARHAERLTSYPWFSKVEIVEGDANDRSAIAKAVAGVDVAYYLLHALMVADDFVQLEKDWATTFGECAKEAGVSRIIYLGGMAEEKVQLSPHLSSRAETGEILRASGVPTIELRAGVVIGSGSASFKAPSRVEMNSYIQKLEKTLNKSFPLVTDALPSTLDSTMITELPQRISMDPVMYQNALQWMNASLSAAHQEMEAMKKSPEGFDVMDKYQLIEDFDNCAEYSKCMSDPEVVSKIAAAQSEQQLKKEKEKRNVLENKLDTINNNSMIQSEAKKNIALIKKSKEIEEQAKSGDLMNQFNLSNNDDSLSHFVKPSGVNKLANMKKNNPKQYAENEKNNGQMLGLGTLFNSISNTLG
jgi:hypothetical protein